ncbi:MAG: hypothetical protein LH650_15065 [Chloroflexi bacterium]|nr:hypothetical protein [Chloroflexota bacterium]
MKPARRPLLIVTTLLLAIGVPASTTLAQFTDPAVTTGSFAVDTLAPPTVLGATGGATVTLTWTPSADTYATGYAIYRSETSGSGYTLVSTATPGTANSKADSPGAGTWYYVVRTTFASWDSVDSNQASAIVTATSTTFMACVTTAADTSGAGDNNGYQSSPTAACTNDNIYAEDTDSGTSTTASCGSGAVPSTTKDRHRFHGFAFGLPGAVNDIDGIRVQADLKLDAFTGTNLLCAQLSWNGGTTWTTIKTQAIATATETTYTFGGTADTWGRAWTLSELSTTNFRVRIIDASTITTRDFQLDYLAVSVTYAP